MKNAIVLSCVRPIATESLLTMLRGAYVAPHHEPVCLSRTGRNEISQLACIPCKAHSQDEEHEFMNKNCDKLARSKKTFYKC